MSEHDQEPATIAFALGSAGMRRHPAFPSSFVSDARDLVVYLPPGYDEDAARRYAVLYLHDGQNLFDGATSFVPGQEWQVDETAEALIRAGAIEPLIIVGVYNLGEHRIDEYTPTCVQKYGGGDADLYGRMLVEEIKPFVDREYRTLPDPVNCGLGGSSLGGLVTLFLGLQHPDVFGKLAVLSPSVWWDDHVILRIVNATAPKPRLRIWLDIGTREGDKTIADARALRDTLVNAGWTEGDDLVYAEIPDAEHNELAWASRVDLFLKYLFPATLPNNRGRRRTDPRPG